MPNQLFQFSVLHPVQQKNPATTKTKVIPLYPSGSTTKLMKDLAAAKAAGDREKMLALAQAFRSQQEFIKSLDVLQTPFAALDTEVMARVGTMSLKALQSAVATIFGAGGALAAMLANNAYKTEILRLADSIVACSIGSSKDVAVAAFRPALIRARRMADLLECLSAGDPTLGPPGTLLRAQTAVVGLPSDIFPLPPADRKKLREAQKTEYEKQKTKSDEHRKRLVDFANQIAALSRAKLDIRNVHSTVSIPDYHAGLKARAEKAGPIPSGSGTSFFASIFGGGSTKGGPAPVPVLAKSSWVLTDKGRGQLKETTQSVIKQLPIAQDAVNVQHTVKAIDAKIASLSASAARPTPSSRTLQIGGAFMAVPPKAFMMATTPGTLIPRPGPGGTSIYMPPPAATTVRAGNQRTLWPRHHRPDRRE